MNRSIRDILAEDDDSYYVYVGSAVADGGTFVIPADDSGADWQNLVNSADNRLTISANDWVKFGTNDYQKRTTAETFNHLLSSALVAADYQDLAGFDELSLAVGDWVQDSSDNWFEAKTARSGILISGYDYDADNTNFDSLSESSANQLVDVDAVGTTAEYDIVNGDRVRAADGNIYDYSGSGETLDADTDLTSSDYTLVDADFDLESVASTEVDLEPGDTVQSVSGTQYTYRGPVASVDIVSADYTSADWSEIAEDIDVATVGKLSLSNDEYIVHSDTGNLYRYIGATGTVDVLSAFDSANPTLDSDDWARVIQGEQITGQTIDLTSLATDLTQAGASATVDLEATDVIRTAAGEVYEYSGSDAEIDLESADFTGSDWAQQTLAKGQWVKTSATAGYVNYGAAAATTFASFTDDVWGDVQVKAGIARTDVSTGTLVKSGDWIREGTGSSTQYYERLDTNELTSTAAHGLTNGVQKVVVSTISTGEDFTDGTRWQSVAADTASDLDYSTVTGQTRLDVGSVVTDGADKYQLLTADTGISGLSVGDIVYAIEGANSTQLYLSADRVDSAWSPSALDRVDFALAGQQALSRFALATPTYTVDAQPSTQITAVDTTANAFTLVEGHGIESGDVIFLAGIGASDLQFNKPGEGFVDLPSDETFFAIVDGNTLKLAVNSQEVLADNEVDIQGTATALTGVAVFGTQALVSIHEDSTLNQTYNNDYLFKLTAEQRQDRIDERTTSISTLQTPLNLALAAYLLPHAETLGEETLSVENLNVSGTSVTLTAIAGEIGASGTPELYDLRATGSIDDLTTAQRVTLSTASPADIVGRSFNRYSFIGTQDLTATDLEDLDFSDTTQWQKLTVDHFSETERDGDNRIALTTGDRVLIQYTSLEYGIYVYRANASVNLSTPI